MKLLNTLITILVIIIFIAIGYFLYTFFKLSEQFSNTGTLTLYYLPGCSHCESMKGEWAKYKSVAKNVNVTEVNAKTQSDKVPLGIKGYPTIIYTSSTGNSVTYTGDRTAAGFASFVTEQQKM